MMRMLYFFALLFAFSSCNEMQQADALQQQDTMPVNAATIGVIPLPKGYVRLTAKPTSFAFYSRGIALKKDNTVYLFNGAKKENQSAQYAVLNIDVGSKDLQQCADAAMRLRAEYSFAQKNYGAISFQFTNGFVCDFEHYANGYTLQFSGNHCNWIKQNTTDYSHNRLRKYLDVVYAYAGTQSLFHQMRSIPFSDMAPGTVLLQKREPYGHAVTVMDWAYNASTHDTIFLLCQSYMPAQDIHILKNPQDLRLSPWYSTHSNRAIQTPEWTFTKEDLKSFD